ncbi:SPASM domain-containing protein [Bradyrhizobium macuxiense]|nr:SPASM domain-containing protein [Bradyrhizobium macuxiense]
MKERLAWQNSGPPDVLRIWYVAPQRLCNFSCPYCVSTGEWAKDPRTDWRTEQDLQDYKYVVHWLGSRDFPIGLRLASLGEPLTSKPFLAQASWLCCQDNVRYVELVTNGSLLKNRLSLFSAEGRAKLSLWITYHPTEIGLERFVENVLSARDEFGCFVVVNALLFPNSKRALNELSKTLSGYDVPLNVDLGYIADAELGTYTYSDAIVPASREEEWKRVAAEFGCDEEMIAANIAGLDDSLGRLCGAGNGYIFIGIDGEVYPCSRYYDLKIGRLGNILDRTFVLPPARNSWNTCMSKCGCSNKEDFLNLQLVDQSRRRDVPSLGWLSRNLARPHQNPT